MNISSHYSIFALWIFTEGKPWRSVNVHNLQFHIHLLKVSLSLTSEPITVQYAT